MVPLFVAEPATRQAERWLRADPQVVVWMLTRVELLSALARRRRDEPRANRALRAARNEIVEASEDWSEITAVEVVRRHAERIVETHPLRAADALQLGAAIVAADEHPQTLELVTLDERLAEAAAREGFRVLGVS
ncbi:MAG: type II toxin-antitoxin system VapC family toxin [Deltaproteobacteria bacterium]|nr:type II toxin-antitoxin system VapC family toxin [Deltaproteobacteria bacterium]